MIRVLQAIFSTLQCRLYRGLGSAAVLFAFEELYQFGGESGSESISAIFDRAWASAKPSTKPSGRITDADWLSPNQLIQSGRCRVILAPT